MGKVESVENEIKVYVSPQIEVLEVEVEKGFAASGSAGDDYKDSDDIIDI